MRIEHWIYALPLKVRSLFRRQRVEQDLDDELQYHLDRRIEEYVAQGRRPEDARRAAIRAMDGLAQHKEECRDARGVNFFDNTLRDVRYSLRVLAKSPGFTATAVLTLALAIGANAVVFGILNALILRPVNVPHVESLFEIQRGGWGYQSYPDYLDMRDRNRSFDGLAASTITAAGLATGSTPVRAWIYEVTGNYFDVLGIQPYLGRFFNASDEHGPDSAPYIVLSWAYWHSHFQDDRDVVGRVVRLNKHPFTIVGVAPADFTGTLMFFSPDLFTPLVNHLQVDGKDELNLRGKRWVLMTMGHLKRGVTPKQAVADLDSIGVWLEKTYPNDHGKLVYSLNPPGLFSDVFRKPARAFLAGLMLLAGLILFAACANLGSLFAARAADRGREVALRLALGGSRGRILRTLFTEALLISMLGGAIGLWGSIGLLHGLSTWRPLARFPIHVPVQPDSNVYLIAVALALISGVLFGLVPVRQVLRTDPYQVVKGATGASVGKRVTVRDVMLVAQIAICGVLVTASLVAVRGLARSVHADFGFDPRNVLLVDANLNMAGYRSEAVPAMQKRLTDVIAAIPGVTSVGLVDNPPLVEGWNLTTVYSDRTADLRPANAAASAVTYFVSPEYFEAAATKLLSGRLFTRHDDPGAPRVAIVNREFARKVLGSVDGAVGSHFKLRGNVRVQVVGLTENGKYTTNIAEDLQPAMFFPMLQAPTGLTWLVVRSSRDTQELSSAIRSAVRQVDAELPLFMQTWEKGMDGALFGTHVAAVALGVLGAMGAMLSITGIFGMAAYSVSKRLRELGIRMALGARRKEVLQAGVGRAVRLLAVGGMLGLAFGILSSRVLAAIVYQASPRDPLVLGGVILSMLVLGLIATWIPAQRALSLDPVKLLREE